MPMRFRCAVVTGASSGIGLELCRLLAPQSELLVLVARRLDRLEALAAELGVASCQVRCIQADLEIAGGAQSLWTQILALGLSPDLWVNNAGFGLYGDSLELPVERELAMIELNISSLLVLSKLAANQMLTPGSGGGTILNLASVASFQPGPRMACYFASKSFVLSYSQALDLECRSRGVRVLALCPGNTSTAFHAVAGTHRATIMHKLFAMTAADVARLALAQIHSGRRVVVAGILNQVMVFCARRLPQAWILRLSGQILKSD